ncbi:hypothetical protein NKH77_44690 [Streptomyces sp. M19]
MDPAAFDGLLLPGGHAPVCGSTWDRRCCARRSPGSGRWGGRSGRSATGCWCWRARWTPRAESAGRPAYHLPAQVHGTLRLLRHRLAARAVLPDLLRVRRGRGQGGAPRSAGQFERGPLASARGTATDDAPAFVVQDGNYLSARWPGDAYLFARRFKDLLEGA